MALAGSETPNDSMTGDQCGSIDSGSGIIHLPANEVPLDEVPRERGVPVPTAFAVWGQSDTVAHGAGGDTE